MWRVIVPNKVRGKLRYVPLTERARILEALGSLEESGPHAADVRHLVRDEYRQRVGSYRVLFRVNDALRAIQVQRIERRSSTTYRKRR